jgi:3',5'-cyclic AMP phosphodiesterase CpdA
VVLGLTAIAFAARADPLRVGIFADLHAHDENSLLDGFEMVDWADRLGACVDAMNAWPADLMIELGDFVNGRFVLGGAFVDAARIPEILSEADAVYARFDGPRYYVLGNHDLGDLSKQEFLDLVATDRTTQSFDAGGFHFVLLDAQYRLDGSDRDHEFWYMQGFVSRTLLDWLADDLAAAGLPAIVCVHQRLDLDYELRTGGPEIANYLDVRAVLERAGNVVAVFQGHDHWGGHSEIEGIHYVTFSALIGRIGGKPPTWAHVMLDSEARTIAIEGVGEQESYVLGYGL